MAKEKKVGVDWSYYNKFGALESLYLPMRGEGENMATQIVTAVSKLVYKWYNDGDVFDNTHHLRGWWNDLSSYANWLIEYTDKADALYKIAFIKTNEEYEQLLKELTDATHDAEYLEEMAKKPKQGSIYECDGVFKFVDLEDEEDEYYEEDEDDGWDRWEVEPSRDDWDTDEDY